ncbi:unknown [Clostridium sp. CAG:299]|nr:unknown [Clostridium sp. CAG:299]
MGDRQTVFNGILSQRVVGGIADLLVHNGLHLRILGRVNAQAAAEQQVAGLGIRISQLLLQGLCDLLNELVRIVGIGSVVLLVRQIHVLDSGIHVVGQGLLLLLLGDVILIVHLLENGGPPFGVVLGSCNGIQAGRVFRDGSDDRAFRQSQLRHILIEIAQSRRLDAQSVVSKVNRIQVIRNNNFPIHVFGELERQILFLDFTLNSGAGACLHTAVENRVFNELLSQGAGAALIIIGQYAHRRSGNGTQVNAAVLPEAGILNSHKGVDQILRKFFVGSLDAVGVRAHQSVRYIALTVVNRGKITAGSKALGIKIRGCVNDALKHSDSGAEASHKDKQAQHKSRLKKRKKEPIRIFLFAGTSGRNLPSGFFSAIIHTRPPLAYHYSKSFQIIQDSQFPPRLQFLSGQLPC